MKGGSGECDEAKVNIILSLKCLLFYFITGREGYISHTIDYPVILENF